MTHPLYELTPQAATHWIGVLNRAEPLAKAVRPSRVCDYGPWNTALVELGKREADWPNVGQYTYEVGVGGLAIYADIVSKTGWPEDHESLSDFALRFLEADVMLFRSGYTKRHLLRRLRQANLNSEQTDRAKTLVKRAVVDGTGLEEFREFCRLAVQLMDEDFKTWLEELGQDAYVTVDDLDWSDYSKLEAFDNATRRKLTRYGWNPKYNYAFRRDFSLPIVKTADLTLGNKIKVNAWRMLRHFERTQASRPKTARSPT